MGRFLDLIRTQTMAFQTERNKTEAQDRKTGMPSSTPLPASKTKETNLTKEEGEENFIDSLKRLEAADILLAVSEDGDLRIAQSEADAHQAVKDGFTLYAPRDVYYYVRLEPHERRMLHNFKRRIAGTVEWTETPPESHQFGQHTSEKHSSNELSRGDARH